MIYLTGGTRVTLHCAGKDCSCEVTVDADQAPRLERCPQCGEQWCDLSKLLKAIQCYVYQQNPGVDISFRDPD